ncbi:hypothetical protein JCM9140_1692 [Halalkalibacter wakoensis JCM 9140]|uniref:DUF2663 family protein n=1 Tax=Halalkalibacter wakoensis JCM 9140 TaxID=1236970 RepID=W4Q155_9BACI|nr:DUF2663 family protein [Halalkalibacter wakoensis]GAE25685.1 hypothetical protein JCM9140_1692 [Halalkalibacter wakoensis JCM 9140]
MKVFKEWNVAKYYGPVVVKVMLEELISRKEKLEKMEKAKMLWSLFAMGCVAVFLLFGTTVLSNQQLSFQTNLLSAMVSHPLILVLMLLLSIGFIQLHFFGKKAKKAEKEFDQLREELIDRNTEFWDNDTDWKAREALYSYVKKEHDINLYHK